LKYLVLANMLMKSGINPFDSQEVNIGRLHFIFNWRILSIFLCHEGFCQSLLLFSYFSCRQNRTRTIQKS
jgi:hypothetical protein